MTTPTQQISAQHIFDRVATHLLMQNKQSLADNNASCVYRSSTGLKCAAGCLIPDDQYQSNLEGIGWDGIQHKFPEYADHCKLIALLQNCHDDVPVNKWPAELKRIADKYCLKAVCLTMKAPKAPQNVIKDWAEQILNKGNSGPLCFINKTLYSYGTPIAMHLGHGYVACTMQTLSPTSAAHLASAKTALLHRFNFLHVAQICKPAELYKLTKLSDRKGVIQFNLFCKLQNSPISLPVPEPSCWYIP